MKTVMGYLTTKIAVTKPVRPLVSTSVGLALIAALAKPTIAQIDKGAPPTQTGQTSGVLVHWPGMDTSKHTAPIHTAAGERFMQAIALSNDAGNLLLHGDVQGAATKYQDAITLTNLPMAHEGLGNVLASQGKFAEALEEYKTALGDTPLPNTDLALEMALTLEKLGRPTDAIVMYRAGMRLPINPIFLTSSMRGELNGRSYATSRLHDDLDAREFDIDFAPDEMDTQLFEAAVHTGLGQYHNSHGRTEEAFVELNHAIELDPNFAAAYYYRGWAYHRDLQTHLKAQKDWQTAVKLDSGAVKEKAEMALGRRIPIMGGGSRPNPSYHGGPDRL